ncbi:MAG: endonuclease/exonuclease/phosphatase family protein, partial [Verrucomicrobiales bacterium]|nr:endonuclease/exonuclease/phosphatase family protein [Verrucomicrobiales bacterium]
GFYNAQFKTLTERFECCDDMPNRARRLAGRIRATGFDVIALGEVFDSDAKDRLVDELSPTFPHFVRLLNGAELRQDSGLMLFSRYPFVPFRFGVGGYTPFFLSAFSAGLPWADVAFVTFERCHGLARHSGDCFANKGAGLVRIQNTNSGRIYNVAFTHLDAGSDGGDVNAREAQLPQIRVMLQSVLGEALTSEDVFLMGDTNIKGAAFLDRPEWDRYFGASGRLFERYEPFGGGLGDAWEAQTNLPELRPVPGDLDSRSDFRDQGLTSNIHAPGGAGNRKDYLLVNRPSSLPADRVPLRVQHMAIAFGLRDSLPVPLTPIVRFEPAAFGWAGRQDLSDHYGIIADLNLEAPFCSPQTSSNNPPLIVGADPNVGTVLRGTLVHPGSMHWYRFDQPGTYSLALRSGNFTNHVYDSRQLSLPIRNYRGETRALVDPTGTEVTARIFDVPESPAYVRVSHIHRAGRGDYELIVRRHEGSSPDDAVILTPNNNTRPYRVDFVPSRGESPCRWFRFNTARSDSGRSQHLTFFVRPFTPGSFRLSVLNNAVPRSSLCAPPEHLLVEREGETLVETELVDFAGGEQLFMVVRPSERASTVSFQAGWDTDLTVIHPYVPGYCPGSATATSLTCREETDGAPGPGDDHNVRMEIAILNRDSGAALVERGPFALLDSWDKGRNRDVQDELGTIRFLPSENVRVRLIVRDRPRDDDSLSGLISSLGRFEHRRCNTTLEVRGHGGLYDLNFHMSHGVPATP